MPRNQLLNFFMQRLDSSLKRNYQTTMKYPWTIEMEASLILCYTHTRLFTPTNLYRFNLNCSIEDCTYKVIVSATICINDWKTKYIGELDL